MDIDLKKAQKAFEENNSCKFGSLEELYYTLVKEYNDYQLSYNGQEYFLVKSV